MDRQRSGGFGKEQSGGRAIGYPTARSNRHQPWRSNRCARLGPDRYPGRVWGWRSPGILLGSPAARIWVGVGTRPRCTFLLRFRITMAAPSNCPVLGGLGEKRLTVISTEKQFWW